MIRAYGAAARELLDTAKIVEIIPFRRITVTIPYELSARLAAVVSAFGIEAEESTFEVDIRQTFRVVRSRVDAFVNEVNERTSGRATVVVDSDEG